MAQYVDGFVIPIKSKNLKDYKKMAKMGCEAWMRHGALAYYECVADDHSKYGLGFKKMCGLKSGETVVLAFIIYKSKAHRDQVNKKVMKEMAEEAPTKMPFDMKRFAMAGCRVMVSSK